MISRDPSVADLCRVVITPLFCRPRHFFFYLAPHYAVGQTSLASPLLTFVNLAALRRYDLDVDAELGSDCDALAVLRAPVRGALSHSEVVGDRVASMSSSHAEPVPVAYPSLVSAESAGACVNQCRSRNDHCSAFATQSTLDGAAVSHP
ncbi:hypothetical protein LshimejAT787_0311240 [Lyophyllum shimeji]|uniref:Uncharacterized protein n=1 Tax=Lyophyllum shimeji TaxID=47721 RepID=A0A9P3UKY3_LYOSH|nr:hypothetical protein LshimejAT787_0311240 [Lyophyllum shimeji]